MQPYEPFGKKPAGSGPGQFGSFGAPKPPSWQTGTTGNFGVPGSQKPAAQPPFPSYTPLITPKPAAILPNPVNRFGAANPLKPKRNFWGDIDGDGKETSWDDMLGDGLLGDAMLAEQRARNGEPPEREDEFLIGRRPAAPRQATAAASPAASVLVVLAVLGISVFMCYMAVIGFGG